MARSGSEIRVFYLIIGLAFVALIFAGTIGILWVLYAPAQSAGGLTAKTKLFDVAAENATALVVAFVLLVAILVVAVLKALVAIATKDRQATGDPGKWNRRLNIVLAVLLVIALGWIVVLLSKVI